MDSPPIGSILIAFLAAIIIVCRQFLPNFDDNNNLFLPGWFYRHLGVLNDSDKVQMAPLKLKLKFGLGLSCDEIRQTVDELNSLKETEGFLIKYAKDISAESVKLLLDCEVLTDSTSLKERFFTEFADWTTFKTDYPDLYKEIISSVPLDVRKMTSHVLETFPIEDLLEKLDNLDDEALIYKLPMRMILDYLIKSVERNFDYWKLFTENCFDFLEPDFRVLVMNFFALVVKNEGLQLDDLLLLLARSEVFLSIELKSLSDLEYLDLEANLDDKTLKFMQFERFFDHFMEARRSDNQLLQVPLLKKLREALKQLTVYPEVLLIKGSLAKVICTVRPYDPEANYYDPPQQLKPIKKGLLKIFTVETLFKSSELSFDEFIGNFEVKSDICVIETLRAYSNDVEEILTVLRRYGAVYEDVYYVLEWIKKAFELHSPQIINFHLATYEKMIKFNQLRMILLAIRFNFNAHHFYSNCESEMFRTALMLPADNFMDHSKILTVDFVDFNEKFEVLSIEEALSLAQHPTTFNDISDAKRKLVLNHKLKNFMTESFKFYLNHREFLVNRLILVQFKEMNGQDTGGLARHFISVCLSLLVEEKFGFFHFCNGRFVPRTMLNANILGFLGMLHGQCMKVQSKIPWEIDFDINSLPITLCDVIKEISETDENGCVIVPTCEDLLVYVNEKFNLFEERFDLSALKLLKAADDEYFEVLRTLEVAYWKAGSQAYKSNLLRGLDSSILRGLGEEATLKEVWELLRPKRSSEIGVEEFLECFEGSDDVREAKEAIRLALQTDPSTLIPLTLKFVTGSTELPPGGLSSLQMTLKTVTVDKWTDRRLPQASTCTKAVHWTVAVGENIDELSQRFLMAIRETKGFELK